MQSFISESIDDILHHNSTLKNVILVLPSQRAKVFVRNILKRKVELGFLPILYNIEEWISEVSGLQKIEASNLVFEFYKVYSEIEASPEPFKNFIDWAPTVLNDFNEIDQYLVDTKRIFDYVRDIERLQNWSVSGSFQETELIKSHRYFLQKLNPFYEKLYASLVEKKLGYQGVLYREAVDNIEGYLNRHKETNFYFLGFNALNRSEEFLFKRVVTHNNSEIYWDIDDIFLQNNHQVAHFISKYKSDWTYYEENEFKFIRNNFNQLTAIEVIGASKQVSQLKYVSELLLEQIDIQKAALILGDESVLPVVLNSIPSNIEGINITMGYELKNLPITGFFSFIIQLQSENRNSYYYKDVFKILNHSFLREKFPKSHQIIIDNFISEVELKNKTFIGREELIKYFESFEGRFLSVLKIIFSAFESTQLSIVGFLNLIDFLKEESNAIEKESLFRFYTIFNQLSDLEQAYGYLEDLKTLSHFFDHFLANESLYFQGEPLSGLQIMGLLETRVLDFENLIITGVNEGILPKDSSANSFIPFDVKLAFKLPTYREKDAIFAYHFFRLISRAKRVTLLYNAISDDFGRGEPSRLVKQLELLKPSVLKTMVSPPVHSEELVAREIVANSEIKKRVEHLLFSGVSSTAITTYLNNPLSFYKKYVLGLNEPEEVEETIASRKLGNVIHFTLKALYLPYLNQYISVSHIKSMKEKSESEVTKWLKSEIKEGNISTGKNRLIYEVAKRYVFNFLDIEAKFLSDSKNTLKILSLEDNFKTELEIPGLDRPVVLKGQIDRIDECNGIVRITDYKTGKVEISNVNFASFEDLEDSKYNKAVQLLIYALLIQNANFDFKNGLQAGNVSFKNLQSGFLKLNFTGSRKQDNQITEERLDLFVNFLQKVISNLMDESSFVENLDSKY